MNKTKYTEILNTETGKYENVKQEISLNQTEIRAKVIQDKKNTITQIQAYLSKTDNKVRRYERQVKLNKKPKYTEEEIFALEEKRETETTRIESLELEIETLENEVLE